MLGLGTLTGGLVKKCSPDCVDRINCVRCGRKLCFHHEPDNPNYQAGQHAEGHYRLYEGAVCLRCYLPGLLRKAIKPQD